MDTDSTQPENARPPRRIRIARWITDPSPSWWRHAGYWGVFWLVLSIYQSNQVYLKPGGFAARGAMGFYVVMLLATIMVAILREVEYKNLEIKLDRFEWAQCPQCRYPLGDTDLTYVCPECGRDAEKMAQHAKHRLGRRLHARHP